MITIYTLSVLGVAFLEPMIPHPSSVPCGVGVGGRVGVAGVGWRGWWLGFWGGCDLCGGGVGRLGGSGGVL